MSLLLWLSKVVVEVRFLVRLLRSLFNVVLNGLLLEVSKKTEKQRKSEKITEKTEPWKKPIKPSKILKKPTGSVQFWFYKLETEKTEPNPNRKKTEPNRFELVFVLKNWTEPKQVCLNRFRFKKKIVWLLFLYIKNEPNQKWSPLIIMVFNMVVNDG